MNAQSSIIFLAIRKRTPIVTKSSRLFPICFLRFIIKFQSFTFADLIDLWYCSDWLVCSASTLMQQKVDGSSFFQKSWDEFKLGFGATSSNFWFGNQNLYMLTNVSCTCQARVEVSHQDSTQQYPYPYQPPPPAWYTADYTSFSICSESDGYALKLGTMSGTAGSSFNEQNNTKFSTFDRNNNQDPSVDCGTSFGVGWWYGTDRHVDLNITCGNTNLNAAAKYFYWSTFNPKNLVASRIWVTCANKARWTATLFCLSVLCRT